jgi:hypothetical protein
LRRRFASGAIGTAQGCVPGPPATAVVPHRAKPPKLIVDIEYRDLGGEYSILSGNVMGSAHQARELYGRCVSKFFEAPCPSDGFASLTVTTIRGHLSDQIAAANAQPRDALFALSGR